MGCRFITDPETGVFVGIACGPGPRKTCDFCRKEGLSRKTTKLCDWKTGTMGLTCSAAMCDEHAASVRVEKDLCPPHNIRWEEIKAERIKAEKKNPLVAKCSRCGTVGPVTSKAAARAPDRICCDCRSYPESEEEP